MTETPNKEKAESQKENKSNFRWYFEAFLGKAFLLGKKKKKI